MLKRLVPLFVVVIGVAATAQCLIPQNLIVSGGPGKDGIPALTNPAVVPAETADTFLVPEDLVLGVVINGEARAYPHGVLWWHEIINDVLGGRPILVSFCPLTGSGIVSDPVLNDQLHNFGVSGLLFDNNLIMFDRTTDSLWSQMRLDSICGDFSGTRPPLLPIVQSTWAAWKAMHPTTTAVSFDTGFNRDYNRYPYGDYDGIDNTQLLFPQTTIDPRLAMKENVLGITHGGLARAYPVYSPSRLGSGAARGAINDVVNGLSVLVVFDGPSGLAIPFDRTREDEEVLTFQLVDDDGFPFSLRDQETGSLWNLNGVAVSGLLEGERLKKIPTFTAFWFAWAAFNPGTEIYSFVSDRSHRNRDREHEKKVRRHHETRHLARGEVLDVSKRDEVTKISGRQEPMLRSNAEQEPEHT